MAAAIHSLRERTELLAGETLTMFTSFVLLGAWLLLWFGE